MKVRQKNYSYNYSRALLSGLAFLYLVLPLAFPYLSGSDFYIYSNEQLNIIHISLFSFFLAFIFAEAIFRIRFNSRKLCVTNSISDTSIFIYVSYVLMILIIFSGLQLRAAGLGRMELVEAIHAASIPGYGLILLLAGLSIALNSKTKHLIIFIIFSMIIDFIYMGKIYSYMALIILFFYLDHKNVKFSLIRLMQITILGLFFLLVIFTSRASASGELEGIFAAYTFASEFVGVNSTIGWALEYNALGLPSQFLDFGSRLEDFYISKVGHGLALAFPAYFIGNFGDYWFVGQFLYFFSIALALLFLVKYFGHIVMFIILFNSQHLFRHGPDIFLQKILLHLVGLVFVIYFMRLVKAACVRHPIVTSSH